MRITEISTYLWLWLALPNDTDNTRIHQQTDEQTK